MSSPWGWVDRLKLHRIDSKDVRNRLAYLAVTTVLVQMSIAAAKNLALNMKNDEQDMRLSALEERVRNLEHPDTDLESMLFQVLLGAAIALPINFMIAEFAAIAYSQLRVIRLRQYAWKRDFKSKSYTDPTVRRHHLKAWEQDRKKHIEDAISGTAEKLRTGNGAKAWKEGNTVNIAGSLAVILANDQLNDEAKPKKAKATEGMGTGSAIDKTKFWNTLPHLANQMEAQVTALADDVRWMEEREIPLFNDGEFLVNQAKQLFPNRPQWLTDALDELLKVDAWQEPDKLQWQAVAQDRLAHIWLMQYISLFEPPIPELDTEFYGLRPGESTPYHRSMSLRRSKPYKVDDKYYLTKVLWRNPLEKIRARNMVTNILSSPELRETYMDIAIRKVRVGKAHWEQDRANIRLTNEDKYYVPPKVEDVRLEYAYILLATDIWDLRTKQFSADLAKIIAGPLPWQTINNLWRAIVR